MSLFKKKKDNKCRFIGTLIWGLLLLVLGLLELAKSLGWINFGFSTWSMVLIAVGISLLSVFGWRKKR